MATKQQDDAGAHKGVIEDDRVGGKQPANRNTPALNDEGLPANLVAIAEDRIGANVDDSEVANADEIGRTADTPRDEVEPLE